MLFIPTYIEKKMAQAKYEYDPATKQWCAWVTSLPGTYAQAKTKKVVKEQLAEVIEDYIFISLKKDQKLPAFKWPRKIHSAYA